VAQDAAAAAATWETKAKEEARMRESAVVESERTRQQANERYEAGAYTRPLLSST
jgi:hypothetical protein